MESHKMREYDKNVLSGDLKRFTPKKRRHVRIFLISSPTDFDTEKRKLLTETYPRLKNFCKHKYDLGFEVIDLHWGIDTEVADDHSLLELYQTELEKCQNDSAATTCVLFIGNKYGKKTLPKIIPEDEMNSVLTALRKHENTTDAGVIEKWYKLDQNASPAEFVLQPISEVATRAVQMSTDSLPPSAEQAVLFDVDKAGNYFIRPPEKNVNKEAYNAKLKNLLQEGRDTWEGDLERLGAALKRGYGYCRTEGLIKPDAEIRLCGTSVMEMETERGILNFEKRNSSTLCFMRDIKNIDLESPVSFMFIDQDEAGSVEEDSKNLLNELKQVKIPNCLQGDNIFKYEVEWSKRGGIDDTDHSNYLTKFCNTFEQQVIQQIDKSMVNQDVSNDDPLYSEVYEHAQFGMAKSETLEGRSDELAKIKEYICGEIDENYPLALMGESGCGISSLMSKAASQTPDWLEGEGRVHIIFRLLGTTRSSSVLYSALSSIIEQLHMSIHGSMPDLPSTDGEIKDLFHQTLDDVGSMPQEKVVIFLDAIERLSKERAATDLYWIPSKLPPNIKLVLSTLPGNEDITYLLRCRIPEKSQIMTIEGFSSEVCKGIVDSWLAANGRSLSEDQESLYNIIKGNSISGLHIKMIYSEVKNWTSYECSLPDRKIGSTISDQIKKKIEMLQAKHGRQLVKRVIGYISAAYIGLTEEEIIDLLSIDQPVLQSLSTQSLVGPIKSAASLKRFPHVLWYALRKDLSECLAQHWVHGAEVITWSHPLFAEEATRYCLPANFKGPPKTQPMVSLPDMLQIYINIRQYFSGKWNNRGKGVDPLLLTMMSKCDIELPLCHQSLVYEQEDGTVNLEDLRFDERKVSQMLYSWVCHHRLSVMRDAFRGGGNSGGGYEIFTWQFLQAWIGSPLRVQADLLSTFGIVNPKAGDPALFAFIMRTWLLMFATLLEENPLSLGVYLAGSHALHYKVPTTRELIDSLDGPGREYSALVAPYYCLPVPGMGLLFSIDKHSAPVSGYRTLMSKLISVSDKLNAFDQSLGIMVDVKPKDIPTGDAFRLVSFTQEKEERNSSCVICASLDRQPWTFIMDTDGRVLEIIKFEELYQNCGEITHQVVIESTMITTLSGVSDLIISDITDNVMNKNMHIGKNSCSVSGKVIGMETLFLHKCAYLMVIEEKDAEINLLVWNMGTARCNFNMTRDRVIIKMDDADHQWMGKEPEVVALGNRHLTCYSVSLTKTFCVFCFDNGDVTYILGKEDGIKYGDFTKTPEIAEDATDSHETRFCFENFEINKHSKTLKEMQGILAVTKTIRVDHFPIRNISCLREAVCNDVLLTAACTSHEIVVYEMMTGVSLVRIRKPYDRAGISVTGKFLVGCRREQIDVFRLDLKKPSVGFVWSFSGHSRNITNLAISPKETVFSTCSEDGSIKIWDIKMIQSRVPDFEKGRYRITNIITATRNTPDSSLGVTFYPDSSKCRYLDVWHVITGKLVETIRAKQPIKSASIMITKDGKMLLLAVLENYDVIRWEISDLSSKQPSIRTSKREQKTAKLSISGSYSSLNIRVVPDHLHDAVFILLSSGSIYILHVEDMAVKSNVTLNQAIDVGTAYLHSNGGRLSMMDKGRKTWLHLAENGACETQSNHLQEFEYIESSSGCNRHLYKSGIDEFRVYEEDKCILQKTIKIKGKTLHLDLIKITPDGRHIVATSQRQVLLVRIDDGRLISHVTLYDIILSVAMSSDSWFVMFGMPDSRLFTLLISDPKLPDHDSRTKLVRDTNPGMTDGLEEKFKYTSDDDERYKSVKMLSVLSMSDTDSEEESDDSEDEDLEGDADELVTSELCSLQ